MTVINLIYKVHVLFFLIEDITNEYNYITFNGYKFYSSFKSFKALNIKTYFHTYVYMYKYFLLGWMMIF